MPTKNHWWIKPALIISGVICTSAILAGTANLFEDAFDLDSIGFLFPIGILALSAGLLISGMAALRVAQMPRGIGWLIILCLAGLLNVENGGGIAAGLSLVALADLSGNVESYKVMSLP